MDNSSKRDVRKIAHFSGVCTESGGCNEVPFEDLTTLKNFQMCLHILLADTFENALEVFLDNLEGVYQPMEMVASDLLKFSVESSIRSSKGTSLQPPRHQRNVLFF